MASNPRLYNKQNIIYGDKNYSMWDSVRYTCAVARKSVFMFMLQHQHCEVQCAKTFSAPGYTHCCSFLRRFVTKFIVIFKLAPTACAANDKSHLYHLNNNWDRVVGIATR